jgi:hypothetical protein
MIKANITDKTALASLSETSVLSYLYDHGWKIIEERDYGYLFGNKDWIADDGLYISIPLAKQIAGDYVKRLSELLHSLSKMENRSQLDIFVEMGGMIETENPRISENTYFERVIVVISGNNCPYGDIEYVWTPENPVLPCKHPNRLDDACSLDGKGCNPKCPLPHATYEQYLKWMKDLDANRD